MLFNHEPIVITENVEVGFVSQYSVKYGCYFLRKIMFARSTEDLLVSNKIWDKCKNLETGEYREMNYGIDLCEKIDGESIKYLVISEDFYINAENVNDGDIIIIRPVKVGNFLRAVLGFPEFLTQKELNYANKIILDCRYPIKNFKSSTSLRELEKIDLLEAKETIEELIKKSIKWDGKSSKVTEIEKEIFKHNLALKKTNPYF